MHVQAAYINDKIPMINEGLCIRFFHVCAGGVGAGRLHILFVSILTWPHEDIHRTRYE